MARVQEQVSPFLRLALVRLVFFVFLFVIAWRLFQLQVLDYSFYQALASGQHDLLAQLVPERGEILIQDPLAETKLATVAVNRQLNLIYAVPKEIIDVKVAAGNLGPILELEQAELETILGKPNDPYEPLKHAVSDELVNKVSALNLAGIYSLPEVVRFYPEGANLAQLLGFVGFVDDHKQGQYGVEGYWEKELAGVQGQILSEKDAAGSLIAIGERKITPAVNGASLVLTIDKNIQFRACGALEKAVKKHGALGGTLIIIEPQSGALRALCNVPNFDPNNYSKVENISYFSNAAISKAYEPGSIFKPITMAAALESGKVTPTTTYVDTGEVKIGPDTIRNSDNKAHGMQNMTNVLEQSLNTGAIFAMRQAGPKEFTSMVRKFGFGEKINIELPHEQPGNLSALNKKSEIYFATSSFGQGITATPLQIVSAFSAVANRGRLMKPYVVQEVRYADGKIQTTNPTFVRQVISPQVSTTLSAMLVSVVERGHGKRAGVPGYYVAGKTGTAEIASLGKSGYEEGKNIGSFVGFAPVDQAKFVMLVKVEEPKDVVFAETSAAPVFGEIAKFLLEYYQVPPEREVR